MSTTITVQTTAGATGAANGNSATFDATGWARDEHGNLEVVSDTDVVGCFAAGCWVSVRRDTRSA